MPATVTEDIAATEGITALFSPYQLRPLWLLPASGGMVLLDVLAQDGDKSFPW